MPSLPCACGGASGTRIGAPGEVLCAYGSSQCAGGGGPCAGGGVPCAGGGVPCAGGGGPCAGGGGPCAGGGGPCAGGGGPCAGGGGPCARGGGPCRGGGDPSPGGGGPGHGGGEVCPPGGILCQRAGGPCPRTGDPCRGGLCALMPVRSTSAMGRHAAAIVGGCMSAAAVCVAISVQSVLWQRVKSNVLTVTRFNFDAMLRDAAYGQWFLDNLRCNQESFLALCDLLRAEMAHYNLDNYTKAHSFEKKAATVLYFLGSQGGYREVAGVFGMSKSWCQTIVRIFAGVLASMASSWVHLPTSTAEWHQVENGFRSKHQMAGVVGAIDGTLIEIQRPKDFDGFYNRHGDPSLNVQAVVDHTGAFTSVDIRPGAFSDRRIWKMSTLGRKFRSSVPTGAYIIGDSGYVLFPWLMVPYLPHEEVNKALSPRQKHFNYIHSSTRMVVECAFGRLKERFRVLKVPMCEKTIDRTAENVMACMVLHNILLRQNDPLFDEPDPQRDRNLYTQPEPNASTQVDTSSVLRAVGRCKRDRIAKSLHKSNNE